MTLGKQVSCDNPRASEGPEELWNPCGVSSTVQGVGGAGPYGSRWQVQISVLLSPRRLAATAGIHLSP